MASAFCGRLGELAEDAGQGGVVEDVDHSQGGAILTLNSLGNGRIGGLFVVETVSDPVNLFVETHSGAARCPLRIG